MSKIVKKFKILVLFCTVLAFVSNFYISLHKVNAQSLATFSFTVEQNIQINNDYSKPKTNFSYILEAVTKDAPLPEGAKGIYVFSINSDSYKNISIDYFKTGKYKYKLYSLKDETIKYVNYDKEVYTLEIEVVNAITGVVVKSTIYDSNYHKVSQIKFTNVYNIPLRNTPTGKIGFLPKTGSISEVLFYDILLFILSAVLYFVFIMKKEEKKEN